MSPFVFRVESGGKLFLQSHSLAECLNMPRLPRPASIHNRIHLGKQRLIQMQQKLLFVSLFQIRLIHSSLMHYVSSLPSFMLINHQAIFLHCINISSCTNSIKECNVEYWRSPHSLKEFVRTYREAAGQCPVY